MAEIILFHAPGACSRVTMNALEEAGAAYEDTPVNILIGEQKSPRYLAVNPKGKVPAIKVDGVTITENPAILIMLHRMFPNAHLLPTTGEPVADALAMSDLMWCASTLHPMVRAVRNPARYTDGDTTGVKAKGVEQFSHAADQIEARLEDRPWFYGDRWAIVDVYLAWICGTAAAGGFDFAAYPQIGDHMARVRARPSFQRALAREQAAVERAGIELPAGVSL